MSTVRQRLFVCLIAIVMVFGVVVSAAPNIAYAESGELNYDKTNVMDDLTSSTVNGQPFDVKDYPYEEDSQAQIVNFVEYCYSYQDKHTPRLQIVFLESDSRDNRDLICYDESAIIILSR